MIIATTVTTDVTSFIDSRIAQKMTMRKMKYIMSKSNIYYNSVTSLSALGIKMPTQLSPTSFDQSSLTGWLHVGASAGIQLSHISLSPLRYSDGSHSSRSPDFDLIHPSSSSREDRLSSISAM